MLLLWQQFFEPQTIKSPWFLLYLSNYKEAPFEAAQRYFAVVAVHAPQWL